MEEARKRLDRAFNDRRLELRLRWVNIASRARMSVTNLNLIRKGKVAVTELSAANLEDAFEWPRGRIAEILGQPESGDVVDPLTGPTEEIGRMVEAYRKRHGPHAAGELLQQLVQANIQASGEIDKNPITSNDS